MRQRTSNKVRTMDVTQEKKNRKAGDTEGAMMMRKGKEARLCNDGENTMMR